MGETNHWKETENRSDRKKEKKLLFRGSRSQISCRCVMHTVHTFQLLLDNFRKINRQLRSDDSHRRNGDETKFQFDRRITDDHFER